MATTLREVEAARGQAQRASSEGAPTTSETTGRLSVDVARHYPEGGGVEAQLDLPLSGEVTVLFGPSGAGKTTLLRCLAGLERPQRGRIRFAGSVWCDVEAGVWLPPQARQVGMLFQDYALFPHLTVRENLLLGASRAQRPAREVAAIRLLHTLGLEGLAGRYPRQLSGGQKQRVALARALVREPGLLLLDEPLSALDAPTREGLRLELRQRLRGLNIPAVVVTHDRLEALALGDRLVVLEGGRVQQVGTVEEVFAHPINLAVAQAVGTETVLPGRIVRREDGLAVVQLGEATLLGLDPGPGLEQVFVCIRAEEVVLEEPGSHLSSARNQLRVKVMALTLEGPLVRVRLDAGFPLVALITRRSREALRLVEGASLLASVKVPAVRLLGRG